LLPPQDQPTGHQPPAEALRWTVEALGRGTRISAIGYLPGGSFHANHAIDVVNRHGAVQRLVLRRWVRPDWLDTDPDYDAHREATILEFLADSDVPAPCLVAADPRGEHCDVPALLLTRLPGRPSPERPADIHLFLTELATAIEAIHSVPGRAHEIVPSYRRFHEPPQLRVPSWARDREVWGRAIEVAAADSPPGRECFIHRDFHPGNTLWAGRRLTGVVDWSYGSWGPAAVDLAHLRWNLAVDFGHLLAEQLVAALRAVTGGAVDHDPYWDVVDALDLVGDLDPADVGSRDVLVRLEEHVAAALRRL
jgi:aminoglycoside phosphotransferase (APT) family kinase protein